MVEVHRSDSHSESYPDTAAKLFPAATPRRGQILATVLSSQAHRSCHTLTPQPAAHGGQSPHRGGNKKNGICGLLSRAASCAGLVNFCSQASQEIGGHAGCLGLFSRQDACPPIGRDIVALPPLPDSRRTAALDIRRHGFSRRPEVDHRAKGRDGGRISLHARIIGTARPDLQGRLVPGLRNSCGTFWPHGRKPRKVD